MERILITRPGGYDKLQLVEQSDPQPGPGEVLVATQAVGVNYADCVIRMGLYASANKQVGWPITPGFEFAGCVAAVGEGVERWRVGDAVLGITLFGGYSSHIVVPDEQLLALPANWTMERAAAFPTVHLTAWYALCEIARPRPGYRVLVHSAAGGVGMAALRICRHLGMEGVGVVGGSHKIEPALRAGATSVIDRSQQDFFQQARSISPGGYDVVLESSGVATMKESYRLLRPTGRLVVFGHASMLPRGGRPVRRWRLLYDYLRIPRFNPIRMVDHNKTVGAFNLSYLVAEKALLSHALQELMGWAAEGALPEPPLARFPLAEAGRAHAALETGTTTGKLVLLP